MRLFIYTTLKDNSGLEIFVNNAIFNGSIYTDRNKANWIVIPHSSNSINRNIRIRIKNDVKVSYALPIDINKDSLWLQPSLLIDSDNSDIQKVSIELKQKLLSRNLKASGIQKYVRDNINHKDYYGHFNKKASETLNDRFGTCVNRARLFVALCRASGIPARTVWGYFYILPEANKEGHHEWAEYLNDNDQWTAIELDMRLYKYRNITEPYIGHIDLIYSAEENPIFLLAKEHGSEILYMSEKGNWVNAIFGFKIIDNSYPLSLTIENEFKLK
jgi:hypothetical protein